MTTSPSLASHRPELIEAAIRAAIGRDRGPIEAAFYTYDANLHLRAVSEQVRYDPRFEFRRTHADAAAADLAKVKSFLDSKTDRALQHAE